MPKVLRFNWLWPATLPSLLAMTLWLRNPSGTRPLVNQKNSSFTTTEKKGPWSYGLGGLRPEPCCFGV
ncbi:MAG TPA: hypothetical protein VNB49_09590, partial [Candidatus Dormibacteraeota bacterium]|nr:hypothetical protein [Candidatus Dormibacteraeota bacterium]